MDYSGQTQQQKKKNIDTINNSGLAWQLNQLCKSYCNVCELVCENC